MFHDCISFNSDVSGWDTGKVTLMRVSKMYVSSLSHCYCLYE